MIAGMGAPAPWVGLLTGTQTERAIHAGEAAGGFHALAVVAPATRVALDRAVADWQKRHR
ncbi:MAG TPA: hypothetical protein VLK35_00465 [Methylomirabilota bacterium]|nr:hypothetical protein [Methylomirabilota bacterium]